MKEQAFKNKIITISGEPVSGKGTTVKMLIEKLKEQGYSEENIHLETTGREFRRYFNSVVELMLNIDDEEKIIRAKKEPKKEVKEEIKEMQEESKSKIENLLEIARIKNLAFAKSLFFSVSNEVLFLNIKD